MCRASDPSTDTSHGPEVNGALTQPVSLSTTARGSDEDVSVATGTPWITDSTEGSGCKLLVARVAEERMPEPSLRTTKNSPNRDPACCDGWLNRARKMSAAATAQAEPVHALNPTGQTEVCVRRTATS